MNDFQSPSIAYYALTPIIIPAVAALLGVLVDAFVPAVARWRTQVLVALAGLLGALIATAALAGTHLVTADGAVTVDGPTLFLQGTIAILGFGSVLLVADRSPGLDGGAFVAQAATTPGSSEERDGTRGGRVQTEVFPLMMFAVAGMMLFPASNDLLTLFVALEVLSLPLYLLCGLARRRRLLSQEAAVKYFLLGAFSSAFFLYGLALLYGYAGTVSLMRHRRSRRCTGGAQRHVAVPRARAAVGRAAVQGRRRAVPLLDPGRLPGRADPDHGVHGVGTKVAGVRCAAAGLLRRLRRARLGLAPDRLGRRDPHDGRRLGLRDHPDRREADARVLLDRARRVHPDRRASR